MDSNIELLQFPGVSGGVSQSEMESCKVSKLENTNKLRKDVSQVEKKKKTWPCRSSASIRENIGTANFN